jgi:hypothetical protein
MALALARYYFSDMHYILETLCSRWIEFQIAGILSQRKKGEWRQGWQGKICSQGGVSEEGVRKERGSMRDPRGRLAGNLFWQVMLLAVTSSLVQESANWLVTLKVPTKQGSACRSAR